MTTSNGNKGGKASGIRRAASAALRKLNVLAARGRLQPSYQIQPYSDDALEALENELRRSEELSSEERAAQFSDYMRGLLPKELDAVEKLLDQAAKGLLGDRKEEENKEEENKRNRWTRERLIKDLQALGIRSKRSKKSRSG
jgi:hypothetical protein